MIISMMSSIGLIYPGGRKLLNEGNYKNNSQGAGQTAASHNSASSRKCRQLNKERKAELFKRLKNGNEETVAVLSKRFSVSVSTVSYWKRQYKALVA